jgi:hypothetical protein
MAEFVKVAREKPGALKGFGRREAQHRPQTASRRSESRGFVIRAYTTSIEFEHKLAAGTQREYKRMLTKAEPEFGDMPLAALEDPRVRRDFLDWREKVAKSSGEREADHRLTAISAM